MRQRLLFVKWEGLAQRIQINEIYKSQDDFYENATKYF